MEDKRINEKESIEIITAMIARTKQNYLLGDGNILLLWGYLTIAVSVLVWVLLVITHNPAMNWLWFLIWIIGGIATPIMSKKRIIKKGNTSYTDGLIAKVWSVVSLSSIASTFFCLGFMIIKGIDAWGMLLAFALIIVPFAEIVNGLVLNEKSYIWGGSAGLLAGIFTACCFAGGVKLYATWYMPVFITAFICMTVIPGHIINCKAKRNQ